MQSIAATLTFYYKNDVSNLSLFIEMMINVGEPQPLDINDGGYTKEA